MSNIDFNTHVGKLCFDKDKPHVMYMVYDLLFKSSHKGTSMPYYKYICLNTGHMAEAPCSHFFDPAAYVGWLTPED